MQVIDVELIGAQTSYNVFRRYLSWCRTADNHEGVSTNAEYIQSLLNNVRLVNLPKGDRKLLTVQMTAHGDTSPVERVSTYQTRSISLLFL